jgi:hypothetical protein
VATLFSIIDIEPEVGIAKRFGNAHEAEIWAALYFRFTAFPWNHIVYTTAAVSTGLNYASGISDWERFIAGKAAPQRLLHYFSPELTFALPEHKNVELVLRLHHRSGVYGLISRIAGAQYATAGVRWRF